MPYSASKSCLADIELPENIRLPKSSDAERYFDLFSPRQLLALALLKQAVDRQSPDGGSLGSDTHGLRAILSRAVASVRAIRIGP